MHLSTTPSFTIPLDILGYICFVLLLAIFFIVLRINSKLSGFPDKTSKTSRSGSNYKNSDDNDFNIEVAPGTAFEAFLNEDPSRRSLGKKEQFAAYRVWRSQRGLNWK